MQLAYCGEMVSHPPFVAQRHSSAYAPDGRHHTSNISSNIPKNTLTHISTPQHTHRLIPTLNWHHPLIESI